MDYKHSPSSYDDATPVNGPVGVRHRASDPLKQETPSGGADAGGTEDRGSSPQTKQAGYNKSPSRGDRVPAGVSHYNDAGV